MEKFTSASVLSYNTGRQDLFVEVQRSVQGADDAVANGDYLDLLSASYRA